MKISLNTQHWRQLCYSKQADLYTEVQPSKTRKNPARAPPVKRDDQTLQPSSSMDNDEDSLYYNVRPSIPVYENVQPCKTANVSIENLAPEEAGGYLVLGR